MRDSEDTYILSLPRPDDFHVHFRQGEAMKAYVRRHARCFGRALAMPNILPPVADAGAMIRYRDEIAAAAPPDFTPLMSFKLLPGMKAETVLECAKAGAVAGKYYPAGATTHSLDGPRNPGDVAGALEAMQEADIPLCVHGEDADLPVLEREAAFLDTVETILAHYPRLRVVLEHLSSKEAARFVLAGPERLAATVTAHHLLFTIDDMLGASMNPHLFCKPLLKTAADRDALREAVFSGDPRFFFGSDSAPHPREAKESGAAPGGVYSSPTAIPALAGLFEEEGCLEALAGFVSGNGADFYRLPLCGGTLRLAREDWIVPSEIDGVVPMCAGAALRWRNCAEARSP